MDDAKLEASPAATAPISRSARLAFPGRNLAALAVLANLLGSVGGGRVLSAGKGVTDFRLLGSGSLMALLLGSVSSLLVLRLAARARHTGRALTVVSALSIIASGALLGLYVRSGASGQLSGTAAVAVFGLLVLRCALWFAARSLRTGLVSAASGAWLGLSEGAYFGGLVIGLLIGTPAWLGGSAVISALALDLLLLAAALAADMRFGLRRPPVASAPPKAAAQATRSRLQLSAAFATATAAFAAATIACQIVVFQLADWLARSPRAGTRAWADPALAAFYLGVAITAVLASVNRPALVRLGESPPGVSFTQQRRAAGSLGSDRPPISVSLIALVAGTLVTGGVLTIWRVAGGTHGIGLLPGLGALLSIAIGSGVFEVLVLALLSRLSADGAAALALAIGLAGSTATVAMLLMLIAGQHAAVWACVNAAGLLSAVLLVRRATVGGVLGFSSWPDAGSRREQPSM